VEAFEDGGLLSGIRTEDISTMSFYAPNINIATAKNLMKGRKALYDIAALAAKKENLSTSEYLSKIAKSVKTYMLSDDFHDRESLIDSLREICNEAGKFVCLLGGKSTGKSTLLKKLAKESNGNVLYIDLRQSGAISTGLNIALAEMPRPKSEIDKIRKEILKAIEITVPWFLKDEPEIITIRRIIGAMVKVYGRITVIIDEANLAFNINERIAGFDQIKKTSEVLQLLTSLTKQESQVNDL
jgi:hypothetical protein